MVNLIKDCVCKECGTNFKGGPRACYCPSCREIRKKETLEKHRKNKKTGNTRILGSIDICEQCGEHYMVNAGLQRFCPNCQESHNQEYDKVTGLAYYHSNKDIINPKRNIKRRNMRRNKKY